MPNIPTQILTFALRGMNDSTHPATIGVNGVARATNCALVDQILTTRPGARVVRMGEDAKEMRALNFQGACKSNPALGQSQMTFAASQDGIVTAAGGRKFHIVIDGCRASVSDETNGIAGVADALITHLFQAEKYVIGQDGMSNIWIWDGSTDAFSSPGYNADEPLESRLANGGVLGAYAHARVVQVVRGNRIIVGDIIHRTQFDRPDNILGMTEQIYYASGAFFGPPSDLGPVTAIAVLPLSNTMHGHADLIIHAAGGCYSLDISHYPRTEWPAKAVTKHLLIGSSATGPYAVDSYDGDQVFRSANGIHTIRSAASNANDLGNPNRSISEAVRSWLKADHPQMLPFASVTKWTRENRVFCTTGLWQRGNHRGGRGILALNLLPDPTLNPDVRAWEGLWTLPEEVGLINHVMAAKFLSGERMFAFTTAFGCDETRMSLVEFDPNLKEDILEDGTRVPISSQVILGESPLENGDRLRQYKDGLITFRNVEGDFWWGVWARSDENKPWELWRAAFSPGTSSCDAACKLASPQKRDIRRNLGCAPESVDNQPRIQILVRWRGYAQLESMTVGVEEQNAGQRPEEEGEKVVEFQPCDYSDYEYSQEVNRWEQQI